MRATPLVRLLVSDYAAAVAKEAHDTEVDPGTVAARARLEAKSEALTDRSLARRLHLCAVALKISNAT